MSGASGVVLPAAAGERRAWDVPGDVAALARAVVNATGEA